MFWNFEKWKKVWGGDVGGGGHVGAEFRRYPEQLREPGQKQKRRSGRYKNLKT